MTDEEKELDKASKHSALAVLGLGAVTGIALFPGMFFVPLAAIPLVALGVLQRLTEKPWLSAAALGWGAFVAIWSSSPLVGAASAVTGFFFVRHWLLTRRTRRTFPKP